MYETPAASSPVLLSDGAELHVLSPLDAIMGALGLTAIYVFPPPQAGAPAYDLDRVHSAFVSTIEEDYPLFVGKPYVDPETGAVGILRRPEDRANTTRFFTDMTCALTTAEAIAHPPTTFLPDRDRDGELLTAKATLLSDGGLVLGYNATHALLDGQGFFTFFNVWSMHYRGVPREQRPVINHDRHLTAPRGVGYKMEHPEFITPERTQPETPAGVAAKGAAAQKQFPATTQKPFHLTPDQLRNLKAAVSRGLPEGEFVSTIDVVTALFLVLITQARGHGQDVKITTGVNARTRFNPPLPLHYAGNCIFNAYSAYTKDELAVVSPGALQIIARRIRASVLRRDEAFLRDAIEFIAQPGAKWIEMRAGVEFFFGNDLMFTSWANMGMYDADFGAGNSVYTGPPHLPLCDGMIVIMDGINNAAGLDVLPLLECNTMDKLTELWEGCQLLQL